MLRILHVAIPTMAGGLERVVEGLAVGHHRRGHDVTVAAIRFWGPPIHPFVEALQAEGVPVEVLWLPTRAYLQERRAIAELCRRVRPDVVHTHGIRTDLVDRRAAARLGIPTVTTVHGPSKIGGAKGAFYEWFQRRNYRRFDAVVAVSTPLRDATLADGVPAERLHLIPNAWSGLRAPLSREAARRELGLPADASIVGWVGRLIHVKGGDVFLEALRRIPEPRPLSVLIGYGREDEKLRRLAASLGPSAQVRFFPSVRDAGRYFTAFDTYVLSSRSEGLPIVILEAMACRTPIVATRVGGIPDALDETQAWLVPSEDPDALAAAIVEALRDRERAAARATLAAQRLGRDFALDSWLDRYEHVYRSVARLSAD